MTTTTNTITQADRARQSAQALAGELHGRLASMDGTQSPRLDPLAVAQTDRPASRAPGGRSSVLRLEVHEGARQHERALTEALGRSARGRGTSAAATRSALWGIAELLPEAEIADLLTAPACVAAMTWLQATHAAVALACGWSDPAGDSDELVTPSSGSLPVPGRCLDCYRRLELEPAWAETPSPRLVCPGCFRTYLLGDAIADLPPAAPIAVTAAEASRILAVPGRTVRDWCAVLTPIGSRETTGRGVRPAYDLSALRERAAARQAPPARIAA